MVVAQQQDRAGRGRARVQSRTSEPQVICSAEISNTNPCNSSPQSVYPRAVRARQSARVCSEAREPGLVPRVLPGLDHDLLERGG